MRLKNKKIIVTAAAQGIGKSTAIAFAEEGADVIATDINLEKLSELSKINENIKTKILDSTNKEAVEYFANGVDHIDVLFHAVGFVHHGTIMDCSSDEFFNSVNRLTEFRRISSNFRQQILIHTIYRTGGDNFSLVKKIILNNLLHLAIRIIYQNLCWLR